MTNDNLDKTVDMGSDDEVQQTIQSFVPKTTLIGDIANVADTVHQSAIGVKGQRYDVGQVLGSGGMGVVLQAFDKNLERTVAMKVLQQARITDGSQILRFIREAEITGTLEHPNIIPLHELGIDRGSNAYYTMKQVKGETLKTILKKLEKDDQDYIRKYPFQRLMEIFLKVCDAMALAHSRGCIHRDLKPDNIMVGDYGEVLVIDWGLARKLDKADSMPEAEPEEEPEEEPEGENPMELVTQAGAVMGTPGYMSPEQVRGKNVGHLSDIFSMGAILYTILTFRPPVTGKTIREFLVKLMKGEIPRPEEYWETHSEAKRPEHLPDTAVPPGLSAVVMKALAIRPGNRYQSVAELKQDVESFQAGYATEAEEASLLRQMGLLFRRSRKLVSVLLLLALSLIIYGGGFAWSLKNESAIAKSREKQAKEMEKTAETNRVAAQQTFADLKSKAPTIANQARYKLETHNVPTALALIDQAVFLNPENGDLHELKGDILQNRFRFAEAAASYKKAIELKGAVPGLPEKRQASQTFAAAPEDAFLNVLKEFNQHLINFGRYQESLNTLHQLGREINPFLVTGRALLKTKNWDTSLTSNQDILYGHDHHDSVHAIKLEINRCDPYLDFRTIKGMGIKDLRIKGAAFLTDWRALVEQKELYRLHIEGARSIDVANLRGLSVKDLKFTGNDIRNIAAVNDMGLQQLELTGAGVTDKNLMGLTGQWVKTLTLTDAPLTHLDFLIDFPMVTRINVSGTDLADLAVFSSLPPHTLSVLDVTKTNVNSLLPLKNHPIATLIFDSTPITSLEGINLTNLYHLSARGTAINNLEYFRGKRAPKLKHVFLSKCRISDLSPIVHLPILELDISYTPIAEFSVLATMPRLQWINAEGTLVRDVTPLKKVPFMRLNVKGTPITDLTPIATTKLSWISFDADRVSADSIAALRSLKSLQKVNGMVPKEFWDTYDKQLTDKKAP